MSLLEQYPCERGAICEPDCKRAGCPMNMDFGFMNSTSANRIERLPITLESVRKASERMKEHRLIERFRLNQAMFDALKELSLKETLALPSAYGRPVEIDNTVPAGHWDCKYTDGWFRYAPDGSCEPLEGEG